MSKIKMLDTAMKVSTLYQQYEKLSNALRDIEQNDERAYLARTEVGLINAKKGRGYPAYVVGCYFAQT